MLFSYNWLQDYIKGKLPKPEKLAEFLNLHSFEVEEVKKTGKDFILDIDILSNRAPDCFSYIGMAREITAILDKKLDIPQKEKLKSIKSKLKPIDLKIECSSFVPRYSAVVIEDVKIGESPQWLKKKLKTMGIRSINNIVDLTNFVMFETGQPLHAFDYDKIKEQKMILRLSKKGEKVVTLDDTEQKLDNDMLVIENKGKLIDLMGIMGGKLSEIDSKTKNIILQAGNFNRKIIYQTIKELKHTTEASNIYIHGIDPNLTIPSLERAYFLLKKLGGGRIIQIIDIYPKKVSLKRIKLQIDYIESLLGVKISEKEIKNILERLDFKIKKTTTSWMLIEIPTFRLDISLPEDLIEEIARIYSLEKIPSVLPKAYLIPPKRNEEIFWQDMVKNILKELGFSEVYNYSFISQKDTEIFNYNSLKNVSELVELENPISIEYKYLCPDLIINLLKNIQKNQLDFDEIKIFELGKTYKKSKTIDEKRMLAGLITNDDFYRLKGVIDLLFNKLGISNIWYDDYKPVPEESKKSFWRSQKCAEIRINNKKVGFLGEISQKILEEMKIKKKVIAFNLNFEKLSRFVSEENEYQPLSLYPTAVRDLAILVPKGTKVVEVLNKINIAGGSLIKDVDIFDIYEGKELPESKKNLAFHIIYQREDRTLSSKEVDKIQQKIIKVLEENLEWEIRQ